MIRDYVCMYELYVFVVSVGADGAEVVGDRRRVFFVVARFGNVRSLCV